MSGIGSGSGPRSMEILEGGAFVITANFDSDNISVLQNTGSGFTPIGTISIGGDGPIDLAVGDLNGDSSQDVVTANFFSNNISVLFGNGAGGFSPPNIINVGSVIEPRAVTIGNFDTEN